MVIIGLAGLALTGCGDGSRPAPAPPSRAPVVAPSAHPSAGADGPLDPARLPIGWTLVAWARPDHLQVFDTPAAGPPRWTLDNPNPQGAPLVLLVEQFRPDWLRVALPVRPNGISGWMRTSDARLTTTAYSLSVDRAGHALTVSRDGAVLRRYPVGIGTGSTPTPSGSFYLAELLRPASPAGPWGPFAFGLSGFSDVITTFNGADGIIGLHGTDQPQLVGRDVSMGCIRLRNEDIESLVEILPLGTPIHIT
jgi:hypothetical protein